MTDAVVAEKPKAIEVVKEVPLPVLPTANHRFSITESGYAYAEIDVTQPVGHSVQDALRPEYWVHHASKLKARAFTAEADRAGAIIRLRTDDHAHYAQLYVRAVHERGLEVQVLGEVFHLGANVDGTKAFDVRWNVGKRAFDVIRNSDREIVASGLKTKEAAVGWITETTKAA
jgi:hypothetical protein